MKTLALLSAVVLLLLLLSGISATNPEASSQPSASDNDAQQTHPPLSVFSDQTPITIVVSNSVTSSQNQTYSTHVVHRGIVLGGLRRLQDSEAGFSFTYTENADYGPFLESVNGLAGNFSESTYWELLVTKADGHTFRPDVGIGCYIPSACDTINLNFNKF